MPAYDITKLPNTAHTVFYAYSIIGPNHMPIGSFEKFGSSFTRTHERIREIMFKHGPITREIIWGGTDISITLTKVELYTKAMFQAFGFEIFTIEDLNQTVDILEVMSIPALPDTPSLPATIPTRTRSILYRDCVPTTVSKDVDTGSAKVVENMTLECRTVEASIESV